MFVRKSELEAGHTEPDWLREADQLMAQDAGDTEPDVVASVADGFSATQSLGILFGSATETDEAADES